MKLKPRFAAAAISAFAALTAPARADDALLTTQRCGGFSVNPGGVAIRKVVSKSLEDRIAAFGRESKILPGMAVAIVKDGKVALLRGYGYADLENCETVSPDTRFYLKSTTKSFLGLLAATLHEEGAVRLDAPITEYLPDLKLTPPLNASQISLRSHFTHTIPYADSGLNYATAAFGNIPEETFVAHVGKFSTPKPIEFEYSNFGPIIGAHALGAAAKSNWRDLLETKIFAPAGMTSSFAHVSKAESGAAAVSYLSPERGEFERTYTKSEPQMHAAGGAFSTIADMARWTQMELGDGRIDGVEAFPRRVVEQTRARQVQLDWTYYEFRRFAAGLGLYDADYEGDVLTHHFGGETHFSFMPEKGIGVVILTNAIGDGALVTHRLAALIYDELLKKPDAHERWARRLAEIDKPFSETRRQIADYLDTMRERAPKGPQTYAPAALAGVYRSERLGEVEVSEKDGALSIRIGAKDGAPRWISGDAYFVDAGLWGEPPALWLFRKDEKSGAMLIDWGGRIFIRDAK